MKNKKRKIIGFIVILVLLTTCNNKNFLNSCSNSLDYLIQRGFFIPKESNIFRFEVTKWNQGSGEYWLYGEDDKYYYGIPQYDWATFDESNGHICDVDYFKLRKGNEPEHFDKFDYQTWENLKH